MSIGNNQNNILRKSESIVRKKLVKRSSRKEHANTEKFIFLRNFILIGGQFFWITKNEKKNDCTSEVAEHIPKEFQDVYLGKYLISFMAFFDSHKGVHVDAVCPPGVRDVVHCGQSGLGEKEVGDSG